MTNKSSPSPYPLSDHFNGSNFHNLGFDPHAPVTEGFRMLLRWQLSGQKKPWPKWVENHHTVDLSESVKAQTVRSTWVNHVTHLIEYHDLKFLTDPVFSLRASPSQFVGPKRHRAPGIELANLPPIDCILLSHNHYDHLDSGSIRQLVKLHNPLIVAPLGNSVYLREMGASRIHELDWWQSVQVGNATVHLVPAQHWSARRPGDRCLALWGGFVIEHEALKVYFAGDTGYSHIFKLIHQRLGAMDLSHLPIGAYEPRWFMRIQHMNPEEAVRAHLDLQSAQTIGNHFGTFQLTDEAIDDPVKDLAMALRTLQVPPDRFITQDHGESLVVRSPTENTRDRSSS